MHIFTSPHQPGSNAITSSSLEEISRIGAARYKVMFASDWPVFRAIYNEKEWVEVLTKD